MKLVKSLLLGSVAGLATVAGAQAADLPSKKAAPVEYVRVCSSEGAGFFYIPGTDTCLRLSGRVRADFNYQETFARGTDTLGFRARARLDVDSRTPTSYGTLRAFFRFQMDGDRGSFFGAGDVGTGQTNSYLDKAFIQWAGITAGRVQSFFDFYAHGNDMFATTRMSDIGTTNALAYTATFGGGFSATLSIESRDARENGLAGAAYAGERMPDIVGALRVDQAWGSAQLMGAIHQLNTTNIVGGVIPDTEYGFAIGGGVKINLPMIAAGDQFWLEAAYSEGATSYSGFGGSVTTGGLTLNTSDAVLVGTELKKTKAYNVFALFLHYWTPQIRQNIYAGYARVDFSSSATALAPNAYVDFNEFQIGSNVYWSPVRNFDIGVEVLYTRLDPRGRILNNGAVGAPAAKTFGEEDVWQARLRIQRDF